MGNLSKQPSARIGIFLPNWLGDCVMATAALRAIRNHFGGLSRVVGILRPYLAELLQGTNLLDEQWYFDPRNGSPENGQWAIVRKIRAARFDIMILMPNSPRCALLAWLGGATERIGYDRNWRGPLLTGKVYRPAAQGRPLDIPMVDYYLRLAEAVGCRGDGRNLELAPTAADERSADEVFQTLGVREDGRIVTLNCSGAYGGAKLWPIEYFAKLARRIVDSQDHDVLVMCGPNERRTAQDIVRLSESRRVFSMAEQPLGIGTAKACIRRSRLMVSTDSGPRHIAAALGCGVITVYGPMMPLWGRNPTVDAVDLYVKHLECIGCGRRVCPYGHHRCMRDLSVDRVYREVVAWMAKHQATGPETEPAASPGPQPTAIPFLRTGPISAAGKI
ncbi:MAG: lipopolysaccharide heptosyltransferase II [Thermoguttaceae bacterium]